LLFCPSVTAQSKKGERVKELFAVRGIEKIAYTIEHVAAGAGMVSDPYEITKDQPLPRLLWEINAFGPAYTVDGKKLALSFGARGKSTGIYVVDAATGRGSELREEHPPNFVEHISWSHDGAKLALTALTERKSQIFVMSSDGSGMHAVAEGSWPNWSVDDKQLVFERSTVSFKGKLNSSIWVANVDGSDAHPVTDDQSISTYPSWLPNGGGILFSSKRDGKFAIYAMDANGGNVKLIMRSEKFHLNSPSISPDGKTLVCDMSKYEPDYGPFANRSVWVVPLDGKGEAVLLTSGSDASVVWTGQELRGQTPPTTP
jgi:Tol biopolymer transport system component